MNVYWISPARVERHQVEDLKSLLGREDGFVWVDLPECDEQASRVLSEIFGFHPLAVEDSRKQTHVPKVHVYADHLFVILHAPEPESAGHIHLLELKQFVGRRYLVTVHGPFDKDVPLDACLRETRTVLQRIEAGRYHPRLPAELSYAIVSALTRHTEALVSALASKVATLERQVVEGKINSSEQVLEAMFNLRHELLTVRTVAAHSREIYSRLATLAPRFIPIEERSFIEDIVDQFERIRSICNGEVEFLQGVIDFYQTRTITKLNFAIERLALITVLLLPVTAVASIYGMNIIVFEKSSIVQIGIVLVAMLIIVALIFRWAKRQGWW
ncbi:MAG TPA: magnesium transporter CorA family protein [Thermodesulfobacteriota bacterium]|nr:magnesium transporter CorA family protein [Thermodesulfobacteriota bacterium]